MNNRIVVVDNTKNNWVVTESTIQEFYEILNGFLTGERDMDGDCIPRDTINHIVAWLPNIESIIINSNDDGYFFDIRFPNSHVIINIHGLANYFVEMIEDGDL